MTSKGDYDVEDEVFIGPISHKEKCISHGVEIHAKDSISSGPSLGEEPSWSPLTGEKFDEICKEAQLLASHLEQTITDPVTESSVVSTSQPEETETFEEDTTAKLSMFSKPADVLSPIKRETFLVQESPMKQLPPAIQKRMLKANGTAGFGKPRLSTSSPVRPAVTQPKMATRGKALVASSGVLPSKPTAQGNSRLSSSTKLPPATKTRLPPPSKGNFGLKRSPSSRNSSRAGSSEDLLSDNTSVASDISDSSFNTSLPGRSSILARNKGRRASELLPRPVKATPIKKTDPLPPPQLQTPAKNTGEKTTSTSSIPASTAKMGSALKGNPKLKVQVVPTPTNYLKGVRKSEVSSSPDVPRIMKPKRLLSACSVDSPENMKESVNQEDKQTSVSTEEMCPPGDLQPCSLVFNVEDEPEEPPACEPAVVENPSEPPSCDPEPIQVDIKPLLSTVDTQKHLQKTEKKEVKEVLLVDAPAPALQPSEKLLIDLSNTPDLIKTSSGKPWAGQLIDLSSPLIKWSPEEKKGNSENVAPLIDLSF
ncbi:hypothetical protein ROHU_007219 [Labeo rohita]|uniref:G2 and S phase-expressed protein 1 N-terminal domain-containing protein n=1 Tax=Labeo rohita TaxID=84645 RepID=A0A498MJX0_LABRO|nr:hypothetical protein ROHU_007219 [Labeo rohita]